jgi:hypothetical protein
MDRQLARLAFCMATIAVSAGAQTAVTTSTPTSANAVPLFQTSSTITNSAITQSSGNVVVGSSTSGSNLSVANGTLTINDGTLASTAGSSLKLLNLTNLDIANQNYLTISQIRTSTGSNWETATTRIQNTVDNSPQAYIDFNPAGGLYAMAFGSSPNANNTAGGEFMRILSNGIVGIGTTTPVGMLSIGASSQFQVSSVGAVTTPSITFTGANGGTQTTPWTGVLCGGDYAEAVKAKGSLKTYEPGDVLVIGDGAEGEVQKSTEPYSTMVTGIYATKPGVIGRRQTLRSDAEEIPMAMIGIVPTKVIAENGSIKRGDLLVTSSTPGYAMKGTDRKRMLGAVIGKALGSIDSGTGVIEVVVTLQ